MAIIPRVDESQILNAGSPVPLEPGRSAGELMGSAVSSFGATVGNLLIQKGMQLDQINKAAKKERAKVDAESSMTDFELGVTAMSENLKRSEDYGNVPSEQVLDRYKQESKKLLENISKKLPVGSEEKMLFEADANRTIQRTAVSFYAKAIKDYNDATDARMNSFISSKGAQVSTDTSRQSLDDAILTIDNKIDTDKFYSNTEKIQKKADARKELISSYIDGHIQKIITTDNASTRNALGEKALSIFNETSPELFGSLNEKEKASLIKRVDDSLWQTSNREYQKIQQQETMDNRATKESQVKNFRDLYNIAINKVTSAEHLAVFMKDARNRADMGVLDPEKVKVLEKAAIEAQGRSLVSSGLSSTDVNIEQINRDNEYKNTMYRKAFEVDSPLGLVSDPYSDMSKKGLSASSVVEMQNNFEKLSSAFSKDPMLKNKVQSSVNEIEKLKNNPDLKRLPREDLGKVLRAIDGAKNKIYSTVVDNPSVDIKGIYDHVISSSIKPVIDSVLPSTQNLSKDDIKLKIKTLGDEYFSKKNAGVLTKKVEDDYKIKINNLKIQLKGGE